MTDREFQKQLVLIKLVEKTYKHIDQLESLGSLYSKIEDDKEAEKLYIISRTTQNAHYDYKLYTLSMFKDVKNHIDNLVNDDFRIIEDYEEYWAARLPV